MIQFRCPKCEQPVEASPDAAGRQVQCASCRALVPVPGVAATPAAPPPALNRRQWYRQFLGTFAFLIPLLLVALGVGGYKAYQRWWASNVWIYVDNAGDQPLTVRLDGDVKATVTPGTFAVVKTRDGSHRLQVTRGDETVFDETKELSKSKEDQPSKYLLNPNATGRYHTHTIQYGAAFFPGGLGTVKKNLKDVLPLLGDDAKPFAGLDDHQVDNLRNKKIYWDSRELVLVPPVDWQDISKYDIVLEQAPKKIKAEITGDQKVINRLSRADYDVIKLASTSEKMTRQELANSLRAMERVVKADWPE